MLGARREEEPPAVSAGLLGALRHDVQRRSNRTCAAFRAGPVDCRVGRLVAIESMRTSTQLVLVPHFIGNDLTRSQRRRKRL